MNYTHLSIANMALAEVSADPITAVDEASLEARETGRWYPIVVSEMLASHAWSWAIQRQALAQLATNDRGGEWLYAYQLPSSAAYPLRLVPNTNSGSGIYQALAGQALALTENPWSTQPWMIPFIVVGSTLYTSAPGAMLEFISDTGMEPAFTPMFARALSLELACRICAAITKSRDKEGDLVKLAEAAKSRAIASDLNQQPRLYGRFVDEAAVARGGATTFVGQPNAAWPLGLPV